MECSFQEKLFLFFYWLEESMFFIVRKDSKYLTPESLKFISYMKKWIQIKSPNFKIFFILSFKRSGSWRSRRIWTNNVSEETFELWIWHLLPLSKFLIVKKFKLFIYLFISWIIITLGSTLVIHLLSEWFYQSLITVIFKIRACKWSL